jgi:MFS superfamily sulfate permease-like transporter
MRNFGEYLGKLKDWVKEGWHFLFEDTNKIQAHHLLAFALTIFIIYLLSYIVERIFTTLVRLFLLIIILFVAYMLVFDRTKFNQLFCSEDHSKKDTPTDPPTN